MTSVELPSRRSVIPAPAADTAARAEPGGSKPPRTQVSLEPPWSWDLVWGLARNLASQTGRDIARSKLTSLLGNAALVFLREAEGSAGQIDLTLSANGVDGNLFVNFSRLADRLADASPDGEEFTFAAPRIQTPIELWPAQACDAPEPARRNVSSATGRVALADNTWMYWAPDPSDVAASAAAPRWRPCAAGGRPDVQGPGEPAAPPSSDTVGIGHWWSRGSCVATLCDATRGAPATLLLVDSAREERMGTGRQWGAPVLAPGEAAVSSSLANRLGLAVGDVLTVRVILPLTLRFAFAPTDAEAVGWTDAAYEHPDVAFPVRIGHLVGAGGGGKYGSDANDRVVLEYHTFLPWVAPQLHPNIRAAWPADWPAPEPAPAADPANPFPATDRVRPRAAIQWAPSATADAVAGRVPRTRLDEYAWSVIVNMPPTARLEKYLSSNYDTVQGAVTAFTSRLLFASGFSQLDSDLPLLTRLRSRQFVTLYLGLVLDILLFILFALSTLLVYSLLMINVAKRTFELAVRRMLGSTRSLLVAMLALQALAYSVPAWILGLGVGQGLTALVLNAFRGVSGIPIDPSLTPRAVGIATLLALAIPMCAAIGPIRSALWGTSLRESLDQDRPKAAAVKFTVERAEDLGGSVSWAIVITGLVASGFGFAIYYLLPLSLLSLNLSLFFNLFFYILLGMLFGLVLLALNLENLLERGWALLLLGWWERTALVRLALANLVAHRLRNRKTMVMYSLSIAFIVFIFVAANQELQSAEYESRQRAGAPLWLTGPDLFSGDAAAGSAAVAVLETAVFGMLPALAGALAEPNVSSYPAAGGRFDAFLRFNSSVRGLFLSDEEAAAEAAAAAAAAGDAGGGLLLLRSAGASVGIANAAWSFTDLRRLDGTVPSRGVTPGATGVFLGNRWGLQNLTNAELVVRVSATNADGTTTSGLARDPIDAVRLTPFGSSRIANLARLFNFAYAPTPVTPQVFNVLLEEFLQIADGEEKDTGLSLSEQLFTTRGNQGTVVSASLSLDLDLARGTDMVIESSPTLPPVTSSASQSVGVATGTTRTRLNTHTLLDHSPGFYFSPTQSGANTGLVSVVTATRLLAERGTPVPVDDLPTARLLIAMEDPADEAALDATKAFLQRVIAGPLEALGWRVNDVRDRLEDLSVTLTVINFFFTVLTVVAMFLCFFSLLASMVANIHEQRKEIGVLLAVGLRARDMIRVYVHEAFLLVLAASSMGILIGCVVAWTFAQQRALFTLLPIQFVVPWSLILTVVIFSAVVGLLAACVPARQLTKQPLTLLLRGSAGD